MKPVIKKLNGYWAVWLDADPWAPSPEWTCREWRGTFFTWREALRCVALYYRRKL